MSKHLKKHNIINVQRQELDIREMFGSSKVNTLFLVKFFNFQLLIIIIN